MDEKEDIYKKIRLWGIIAALPMVFVSGPIAGLFAGKIMEQYFGKSNLVFGACVLTGLLASMIEVIGIIRFLKKEIF